MPSDDDAGEATDGTDTEMDDAEAETPDDGSEPTESTSTIGADPASDVFGSVEDDVGDDEEPSEDTGDANDSSDDDGSESTESTPTIGADPASDVFGSVEDDPGEASESTAYDEVSAGPSDDGDTTAGADDGPTATVGVDDGESTDDEPPGEMVFCRECGERIAASAPTCPHCGAPQRAEGGGGSEKDPGIAALASLIVPGAGQLYNGQFVRGAVAFVGVGVVDVILVVVALVLSLLLVGPLFLLLIPAVHILVAYDAYDQAEKINSGEVTP